ncbi:hypothetical protein B0T16DRAFT_210057 [Cercophora newfieldiana]|uniref:Uncharacterized protein n=1 Tax=Cercophora newfieldiana TaxID=92897 RepID=A0AA39XXF9_9PEZI|nr:hypothetical protein B0T16DRAFT_210057 [Cercophora newfieldiana]
MYCLVPELCSPQPQAFRGYRITDVHIPPCLLLSCCCWFWFLLLLVLLLPPWLTVDRGPWAMLQAPEDAGPDCTPCIVNGRTGVVGALLLDKRGRGEATSGPATTQKTPDDPSAIWNAARRDKQQQSRASRAPKQCRGVRSRPALLVDGRIARGRAASGREARQMASRLACYHDVLPANQRRAIGFSGTTAKIARLQSRTHDKQAGFRIVWKANLLP